MAQRLETQAAMEQAGYRLESVLGRGGMGTVYRATQLRLQRPVAVKLLAPDLAEDESFREQFLRESASAGSLEHPNVVPIYDAGEADGLLYIAMRYVPGSDLQAMIRREGRLSAHVSVAVLDQVASALDAAHALHLVHRDVKPSNVLIGGDHGAQIHALLGDFGLSRRVGDSTVRPTERPVGSVHYMAPEQIRGEFATSRADIYSLGCLFYECLTGTVPFPRESDVAVLYAHLEAPPPSVSDRDLDLPAALDDVIAAALAKSPMDRPESALAFARAAAGALTGTPTSTHVSAPAGSGSLRPSRGSRPGRGAGRPMVGYLAESEQLLEALRDAVAGAGAVVMLAGEPGIGKTTIARELSEWAERHGTPAVWGVGLGGEAAPAYWHWVQVVQALARRREAQELFSAIGSAAGWLRMIVPDLDLPLPSVEPTDAVDGRFRVYDALARLLDSAATRSGLLVVLDDLHVADEASLLALSFIARSIVDKRILIVGTHRDVELERSATLARSLDELIQPSHEIALRGLSTGDVLHMIEIRSDRRPSDALVARIHDVTAGNPLFVSELLRLLQAEGRLDDPGTASAAMPLPARVRDAIAGRLALLSADGREVLGVASVIGTRFRATTLSAAASVPGVKLLELLDQAVRLRLVRPLSDPPDGYAFAHGLIQATLYDALPAGQRLTLHQTVAQALERSHDVAAGEGLAEVAHHYLQAATANDPERAVAYARRAGDMAIEKYAYDQAVGLYTRALAFCAPGGTERVGLLQDLGEAQMRAGDTEGARATLLRAADAARAHDDAVALGRAALECGIWGLTLGVDEQLISLAQEAVARLERSDEWGLLARVKGFLAAALYWTDQVERRERLAAEALALARSEHARMGDSDSAHTLAYVIGRCLLARWDAESAHRDLELSGELLELSTALRHGELELLARNWRITVLLELGRFAAIDEEVARVEQMANELRQPRAMIFLPLHHAMQAAIAGRFDEAEALNARSAEIGQRVRGSVGELAGSAQLIYVRLQQGRLPELEVTLRAMAAAHPEMVALRSALAILLVQDGRRAEARDEIERLTARGLAGFARDCTQLVTLALVGEVAAELGDRLRARTVYEWLEPYSGRWLVSPGACAVWPVDRSLGRLATVAGWPEKAVEHTALAREQSERVGAVPCVALTALDEARTLQTRGRLEDAGRVLELIGQARDLAQTLGMGLVVDAATLVEASLDEQCGADPRAL